MRLALGQIKPTVGDLSGNLSKMLDYAARALEEGHAQAIVFPELSTPEIGGGRGGYSAGGGVGNLSGWILIAALIGFIMGHDAAGALVGALIFGGVIWAPAAFLRRGSGGASRKSVIASTLGGALAGAVLAIAVVLVWDIAFLKELNVGNMIVSYGFLGALGLGGYRLSKRG